MKKMKKLIAVILAAVMVLAMAIPAMATGTTSDEKYSITITPQDSGSHTYKAYQIFSGTLSSNKQTLTNVEWGTGVDISKTGLLDGIQAIKVGNDYPFATVQSAAMAADVLQNGDEATAKEFAKVIKDFVSTDCSTANSANGDGKYVISDLDAGYYLITDTLAQGTQGAESDLILRVVKSIDIAAKSNLPEVTKTAENGTYSIGDTINYTVTGTMPDYDSMSSDKYRYVLTDTMDGCLDLVYTHPDGQPKEVIGGVTVTLAGKDVTNSVIPMKYEEVNGENVLTISIEDIAALKDADGKAVTVSDDSELTVTYSAKLNSEFTGSEAVNKVQLTTNSATTPSITEKVFPINLELTKVDGSNNNAPLPGAQFKLYRLKDDGATKEYLKRDANNKVESWVENANDATIMESAENTGLIEIKGLAQGVYYLEEVKAPDGYNKLEDSVMITIEAKVAENGEQLETLTIKLGTSAIENGTIADSNKGNLVTAFITNNKGATLPSTGGIGTTIFYVIGAIIVVGAVVVLVTRRRMNAGR